MSWKVVAALLVLLVLMKCRKLEVTHTPYFQVPPSVHTNRHHATSQHQAAFDSDAHFSTSERLGRHL